jgi:hypothetical protein
MARLNNKTFDITGSFGLISFYKMKGVDGTIARTKGGASKKKIQKSPRFELTRRHNKEFSAAAKTGSVLRTTLHHVKHLADYNITPRLNALCKSLMTFDTAHALGDRQPPLSQHRHLLDGFSLNKNHLFDDLAGRSFTCSIDRKSKSAGIQVPALLPGFNLHLPWQHPMYRLILSVGQVPDDCRFSRGGGPAPEAMTKAISMPWRIAAQAYAGENVTIALDDRYPLGENTTLIVAVGIEMGELITDAVIRPVKYAGSAKILMAG